MRKQTFASVLLAAALLLGGCSDTSSSQGGKDSSEQETSAAQTTTTAESGTSSAATTTTAAVRKYDYVHGTDGYYNLLDECKQFEMNTQQAGTCWLYAARASMQTSYEKQTGKKLNMEIYDMLQAVYGDEKQEGFFIGSSISKLDLGGYQQYVTDSLSNGFKDGITLDSSVIMDPTDREAIKNAVRTRGGVAVAIDAQNSGAAIFGDYATANYKKAVKYDHAVTVVGWDDHFPKDYFRVPAEQDGAWIIYNSNLGKMLQYISYCSPLEFAISHTVSEDYSEVLSFDAGNVMSGHITTGGSTKAANVFHKKGKLAAVGTFNVFDKQDIKIEIMSADFKNVLYTQYAKLDYQGYHTIKLSTPVDVEDFAVAITYSKGAPVESESFGNDAASYKTKIEKGQSFVFAGGKWKDMTDSDIKSVVKTDKGQSFLDSDNGAWKDYITDSAAEELKKKDFTPGNCCIKALFAK